MKERYSIGEIAQMMGVSVQTLRKYCNRGLITPESVDPKTGYRFFSFNQMHVIDKIIYFRQLGMSLSFIEEAIQQKDTQRSDYHAFGAAGAGGQRSGATAKHFGLSGLVHWLFSAPASWAAAVSLFGF